MTERTFAEKFVSFREGSKARPVSIHYSRAERVLHMTFEDNAKFDLPAALLRAESPSAEVQGHGGRKPAVTVRPDIGIKDIERVGNYAIRLIFDDGHDTGLYSWTYLYELGARGKG
jgi:DUF971 family protein